MLSYNGNTQILLYSIAEDQVINSPWAHNVPEPPLGDRVVNLDPLSYKLDNCPTYTTRPHPRHLFISQ